MDSPIIAVGLMVWTTSSRVFRCGRSWANSSFSWLRWLLPCTQGDGTAERLLVRACRLDLPRPPEKAKLYLHDEALGVHHPDSLAGFFFAQPLLGHGHDKQVSDPQSSLTQRHRLKPETHSFSPSPPAPPLTSPAPWKTKVCSLSRFLVIFRAAKTPATATDAVPERRDNVFGPAVAPHTPPPPPQRAPHHPPPSCSVFAHPGCRR